jgi:hypothetical protein
MDRALVVKSGASGARDGQDAIVGVGGRENPLVPMAGVAWAPSRVCGEDLTSFERR